MNEPFKWDNYSDQPAIIKDRNFKKKMRKKELFSLIKTILLSLIILPLSVMAMPFVKRKVVDSKKFFTLGIDFQRESQKTLEYIDEIGVESILLRCKLWEIESLDELVSFTDNCKEKQITLKIMQDREHIEDLELLKNDLRKIFSALSKNVNIFEIGSTINRAKWGFFSVNEYLKFFQVAYDLKNDEFPELNLIGSEVIDFEYHFTAHTLFNFFKLKYDGIASLLYVDRRGAPENMQLGFTLSDKIALLGSMITLSPKTEHKLYITETNWPIQGTAPYAPTSEYECISEEMYANYMLRYYLLSFASQQVDYVSWHQLIAPGYGLIDNREGLKKREAFNTYAYMVKTLKNAQFLRLDIKRDYYILQAWINEQLVQIHWSLKDTTLKNEEFFEVHDKNGVMIEDEILKIGASPLYIFITKEVGEKVNCL
ncbi:glycosyl hydrolase [Sulfurimonas marina]|uniref:Glycosyl hydrolase n=1 Tax=Sulfurimonas marina TaxID=2590551 RepID=A0A7M1ATS0_9BACT|nr:glycosyl hydrolase [Sulfurimonas marina]QOP40809.1 glycosyl hydrolase [Sulfurimonas marina]